jgi:hypothetical protein
MLRFTEVSTSSPNRLAISSSSHGKAKSDMVSVMTRRSTATPHSGDNTVVVTSYCTHDAGLAVLGSCGIAGQPDVEKRQVVAELQRSCRAKRKRALRGRNHAKG